MNLVVADTYEDLSKRIADDIISSLRSIKHPLICTASGDSPAGLYKELVQRVQKKEFDVSDWSFVGLDEWVGMNGADKGSCRYHLDKIFFQPLQVKDDRLCFFDGRTKDVQAECSRTENFIHNHEGIDVAILGLGMNGHIGMNEPGTEVSLHSHLAELAPLTIQVGQKYFTKKQELSHGLTLGIANFMEAKQVMLIVSGAHKAEIVQKILKEEISEELPGSLLRNHPGFTLYLDKAAARLLS